VDRTSSFPGILEVYPKPSSLDVETVPTIEVQFTQAMDATQFADDAGINTLFILVNVETDQTVRLTRVGYDSSSHTLSFSPSGTSLSPGGKYQITARDTIKSSAGREMQRSKSWQFTIALSTVAKTELSSPGDKTAHTIIPTLYWTATSGASAYYAELSSSNEFVSGDLLWSTQTSQTSALPGLILDSDLYYYWRVMGIGNAGSGASGLASGSWSDPWNFFIGTPRVSDVESTTTYDGTRATFFGVEEYPVDDLDNLVTWPDITVQFNDSVASGSRVTLKKSPIDGRQTKATGYVDGEIITSGAYVTFRPSGTIENNYLYTVTFTHITNASGDTAPTLTFSFTGHFKPLYIGVESIKEELGNLLVDTTDRQIYFQLYRSGIRANELMLQSLYANYPDLWQLVQTTYRGGPTLEMLDGIDPLYRVGIIGFVESLTKLKLLERLQYELIPQIESSHALGDFSESIANTHLIEAINSRIKDLKGDVQVYQATFAGARTRIRVGVKSANYNPYRDLREHRFPGIRDKF
jgi:hypothetical protein